MSTNFKHKFLTATLVLLCLLPHSAFAEKASKEDQIKAAILVKLSQFFSWEDREVNRHGAINFCLLQPAEPLGAIINDAASSHSARSHHPRLDIVRVGHSDDLSSCHILFMSQQSAPLPQQYPDSVLLISENSVLANSPFHLNLFIEESRIRFEINIDNILNSRIKANPQLLNVAKIVKNDNDKSNSR
ncbi:MAG: YfiR family protein [Methylophagaceae bacterium]